ncbi:MAG: glucose-1-phosphate thymidylyltransferase [Armatimonadetes bacterium]|nr:glucose-1-phosphate thymidylyltransferase [Armatimonadota bacterium]
MKGLILSGGKGTRLRPLTHTGAKQLIPVANKPVLFYAIEALMEAGIRDIGIIVGDTAREIRTAVGDGSRWGASITYIQQDAPLGLAHAVLTAEPFLKEEPFVMYLGDNLIKGGVTDFVRKFQESQTNALILLTPVKNPQDFGVACLVDGRVVQLVEKPKEPKSDLALVGVYLFDRHIFEAARAIAPSWRGELEITDAIQNLIERHFVVQPHLVSGWWKDTGKLEDILEANRMVLESLGADGATRESGRHPFLAAAMEGEIWDSRIEGPVRIEKGTRIERCVIRGPVIIGEESRLTDSYVGPFTSIHNRVTITKSEIEHSIVLEGSSILEIGARIEDSLIGKDVTVRRSDDKPKAYKLMLGDHSQVGII